MSFVRSRCNRHIDVPPPAVKGIDRVQHITALGVTLSLNFSMTKHIDTVMAGCGRTLYGLRTLRAHGMPQACLQIVFRSTALAKLLYASPLGGALLMLGRRIDQRLSRDELANQAIIPMILCPLLLHSVSRLMNNGVPLYQIQTHSSSSTTLTS